ncbi:hypothetical protein D3C80_1465520 [compost metagenome]
MQLLHQLKTVHAGHVQVQQHQTDIEVFAETPDRLITRFAGNTTVTFALQKLAKLFNDQWRIVDHKDFYCRSKLAHVQLPVRPKVDPSLTDSQRLYSLKSRRSFRLCTHEARLVEPGQCQQHSHQHERSKWLLL